MTKKLTNKSSKKGTKDTKIERTFSLTEHACAHVGCPEHFQSALGTKLDMGLMFGEGPTSFGHAIRMSSAILS